MDHEVGPWKTVFFHGLIYLKNQFTKPLGSFTKCKPKCGPRGLTMHQKVNVLIIFLIYAQKGKFWIKRIIKFDHSFVFIFSSPQKNNPLKYYYYDIFSAMGSYLFLPQHLFCLTHHKTCWTMLMDNVGLKTCLLGTSNSMVPLTVYPWCKPKWSRDEFDSQSQIL